MLVDMSILRLPFWDISLATGGSICFCVVVEVVSDITTGPFGLGFVRSYRRRLRTRVSTVTSDAACSATRSDWSDKNC